MTIPDNIHTWEDLADEAEELVRAFNDELKDNPILARGVSPHVRFGVLDWLGHYRRAVEARRVTNVPAQ